MYFFLIFVIVLTIFIIFKYRSFIVVLLATFFIIYFIFNPILSINSTLNGCKLFITAVFPSLFPFIFFSNLLIEYDGIKFYEKIFGKMIVSFFKLPACCVFPLIISFLCGYPLGAKYSSFLYENNSIDKNTYKRLLYIASNPSPLFVIGFIGVSIFKNVSIGYILLISSYISCIFISIITSNKSSKNFVYTEKSISVTSNKKSFGESIKKSLDNALSSSLSIGTYVIIFSVIIAVISNNVLFNTFFNALPTKSSFILKTIFLGCIEITNGANMLGQNIGSYSIYLSIAIISFFLGFSGLSIISQVQSFTYKHKFIDIKVYISMKILQGILSSTISVIIFYLTKNSIFNFVNQIQFKTFNFTLSIYIISIILSLPLLYNIIKHFSSNYRNLTNDR